MFPNSWICGDVRIFGRGAVSLGRHAWISPGTRIYTRREVSITIGDDVDIGPFTVILTGSHEIGDSRKRAADVTAAPVVIGDGTWIGGRCTILGGVTIGRGCVVAAGTVVTRDIPDNVMAGGVPARIIKALDEAAPARTLPDQDAP
ncbi:acyltransferase [Sphingosinithalassobacter tenebrarum]|uniref:Acyltransferase n=2 Tax=Stakelama tenebrarum TaxID=2711215 RepID=A0A6G6YBL8_9SPHN|nr:acyltransferase [Sphingosinithalassobacter tenebrarum]